MLLDSSHRAQKCASRGFGLVLRRYRILEHVDKPDIEIKDDVVDCRAYLNQEDRDDE